MAISDNMRLALRKTYDAVPAPKIVIAVGACAIPAAPTSTTRRWRTASRVQLPIDLYVPGVHPIH